MSTTAGGKSMASVVLAVLALLVLGAAFVLPVKEANAGGGPVATPLRVGTGWDLARMSFEFMQNMGPVNMGTPGQTTDKFKLYILAYAWTANIAAAVAIVGCLAGLRQIKVLIILIGLLGALGGTGAIAIVFEGQSQPDLGPAIIAWVAGLWMAFIGACLMKR